MTRAKAACETPDDQLVEGLLESQRKRKRNLVRAYWRVSLVVLVLAVSIVILLNRNWLRQFAEYGYPGVFIVSLLGNATIVLPAPSMALVFAMGGALPPVFVGLVAGAGEALGELTGFLAGYGGRAVVERYDLYARFRGYMEKYGLFAIFFLSVIPTPFFDLAGVAAGALRFPVWQFLLVCWVGKTIKCVLVAFAGAGSVRIIEEWFLWS